MDLNELTIRARSRVDGGRSGGSADVPSGSHGGGEGGGPIVASPQVVIFPWWYMPPTQAVYFYRDSGNQIIAAGAENVLLAGSEFVVGDGFRAVVQSMALVVQLPTAADNFIYTMRRNGGPVQGMDQLRNFAIPANASVRPLNDYNLQFQGGDVLTWTVSNFGAAAVEVGVSYFGYSMMLPEIERLSGGLNY